MTESRRWTVPDGSGRRWCYGEGEAAPIGVEKLLSKGRGKKNRWTAAGRAAGKGVDQVEAERLLWRLHDASLVVIHERRNKRGDFEPYEWMLTEAGERLSELNIDDVDIGEYLADYLAGDGDSEHPVLDSIRRWLEAGVEGRSPNLIRLVLAIGDEIRSGNVPHGRMLAIKVGGHTKSVRILEYREELEEALGFPPEQVIRLLGQFALVYGPFSFSINGRRIDGEWSVPWLALTSETVNEMREIEFRGDRILTIENLAAFEETVRQGLPVDTVAVFTGGFPGHLEKLVIRKLIDAGARNIEHWSDLDFDGLRILRHLSQTVSIPVKPFRMEPELLSRLPTRSITDRERNALRKWVEDPEAPCKRLAEEMLRLGKKAEQESWFLIP